MSRLPWVAIVARPIFDLCAKPTMHSLPRRHTDHGPSIAIAAERECRRREIGRGVFSRVSIVLGAKRCEPWNDAARQVSLFVAGI